MSDSNHLSQFWNDVEYLAKYNDSLRGNPTPLLLMGIEYTKMDAVVQFKSSKSVQLIFQKGSIIDCKGFGNLISGLEESVPYEMNLGDFVGLALSKGHRHDEVMKEIQKQLSQKRI